MGFFSGNSNISSGRGDSRRTVSKLLLDSKTVYDDWMKQWDLARRQIENWAREVKEWMDAQPLKIRKRDLVLYVKEGVTLKLSIPFKPLMVTTVAAWEIDSSGKELERVSIGATDWYFETKQNSNEYLVTVLGVAGLNDGNRYKLVIDIEE